MSETWNPPWVLNSSLLTIQGMSASGLTVFPMGSPPLGVFTPASLPNLIAWYKADSISVASGTTISSWTDFSGNGYHVTQGTATAMPTVITNVAGSLPGLHFDGGDSLDNGAFFDFPATGYSYFAVAQLDAAGGGTIQHCFEVASSLSVTGDGFSLQPANGTVKVGFIGLNYPAGISALDGDPRDGATREYECICGTVNTSGTIYSSTTLVTAAGTSPTNTNTLAALRIGSKTTTSSPRPLKGYLFELVLANADVSASYITQMRTYLSRWTF